MNNTNTQAFQSQHIILQLDTDSLIADFIQNQSSNPLPSGTAKKHTIIYTQGALSMGNPVKDFEVHVYPNQNIFFTIVPLQLFSYHRLYFTGCVLANKKGEPISSLQTVPNLEDGSGHVSFLLPFDQILAHETKKADGSYKAVDYTLQIRLDFMNDEGQENAIDISIDPKLKIRQTG